jgi:hypothetical protein
MHKKQRQAQGAKKNIYTEMLEEQRYEQVGVQREDFSIAPHSLGYEEERANDASRRSEDREI